MFGGGCHPTQSSEGIHALHLHALLWFGPLKRNPCRWPQSVVGLNSPPKQAVPYWQGARRGAAGPPTACACVALSPCLSVRTSGMCSLSLVLALLGLPRLLLLRLPPLFFRRHTRNARRLVFLSVPHKPRVFLHFASRVFYVSPRSAEFSDN